MKSQAITAAYVAVNGTPFVQGRIVTVINMTAGALDFDTADDAAGTNVTTTSIPSLACVDVKLQQYVKGSAAGLYMLGSA